MTTHDKANTLSRSPLFNHLSQDQIEIIAQSCKEEVFQPGDVFIEQGTDTDTAYLITSGLVNIYRITEQGSIVNLTIRGSGELVGEMAILDQNPRSAYVEAIQKTSTLSLSKNDFLKILTDFPEIAVNVMRSLTIRLRELNQTLEDLHSKDLTGRTLKSLQTLAKFFPDNQILLSQEELADIIGATRARVTESLNKLEEAGKITISHRKIHLL